MLTSLIRQVDIKTLFLHTRSYGSKNRTYHWRFAWSWRCFGRGACPLSSYYCSRTHDLVRLRSWMIGSRPEVDRPRWHLWTSITLMQWRICAVLFLIGGAKLIFGPIRLYMLPQSDLRQQWMKKIGKKSIQLNVKTAGYIDPLCYRRC